MKPLTLVMALLLLCCRLNVCCAQDTPAVPGADKVVDKYLSSVSDKSAGISTDLDKQTEKYLARFRRDEDRAYKKLAKKDSAAAAKGLAASKQRYEALQQKLTTTSQNITSKGKRYIPLLDTVTTSLKFLGRYGDLFKKGIASSQQVGNTLSQVNTMEGKMQEADDVQAFVKERSQQLGDELQQAGMGNALKQFNQDAYYYSAQVSEYRAALNDPDKAEQKAIALLNQLPAFRQFMQQNSLLASLFGAPGSVASNAMAMPGLQTRSAVQQLLQTQLSTSGAGGQAVIQQNIQAAQAQLNALKDKISKLGGGSSSDIMPPPGFKPNGQKTKTFLQRLELGANVQTQKSGAFFPTTTDFGFSVGYKLSGTSTVGIGASYKLGWGTDIQHIALSSQGIGFRSYTDIKIKGSFYASGGFEYNYQQAFASLREIYSINAWSKSGLLGVSKIVSVKSKMFKKTKLQLLWDFLSYSQRPVTQPLKFRVGYNF